MEALDETQGIWYLSDKHFLEKCSNVYKACCIAANPTVTEITMQKMKRISFDQPLQCTTKASVRRKNNSCPPRIRSRVKCICATH